MAELVKRSSRAAAEKLPEAQGAIREFLVFVLSGEVYGVELTRIREILSPPPITEVPRAPSEVIGVCSVRGLLVTVVDLRRQLKLEERPATRRSRILLVEVPHGEVMGLFVDEVRQVMRLAETEIELAVSVLGGDISEHVVGISRPSGQLIILLDLKSIVSS